MRKIMSLLVPGASQHQGEPRDITDISLSARLHTGFRGTSARNHREHNLVHESHSRRDWVQTGSGSRYRSTIHERSEYDHGRLTERDETREMDAHDRLMNLESRRATGSGARHSDARTLLTSVNTRRILDSRWRPGRDDHRRTCSRTLMRAIDPTNPAKAHERRVRSPPSSVKTPCLCTCALRARKCAPYQAISSPPSSKVRRSLDFATTVRREPLASPIPRTVRPYRRFDVSIARRSRDQLSTSPRDRVFAVSVAKRPIYRASVSRIAIF